MSSRTNKNAFINQNISKVEPLTLEEVDAEILSQMVEADGEDELSCICIKCGRENMYQIK